MNSKSKIKATGNDMKDFISAHKGAIVEVSPSTESMIDVTQIALLLTKPTDLSPANIPYCLRLHDLKDANELLVKTTLSFVYLRRPA